MLTIFFQYLLGLFHYQARILFRLLYCAMMERFVRNCFKYFSFLPHYFIRTQKERFSRLKTRSSSSSTSDTSHLTPTDKANQVGVKNTSDVTSDSSVITQSARSTRSRTAVQPASVAPLSNKKRNGRQKILNDTDSQDNSFEDSTQSTSSDESFGSEKQRSSSVKRPQRTSHKISFEASQGVSSPLSVTSVSSVASTPVRRSSRLGNSSVR